MELFSFTNFGMRRKVFLNYLGLLHIKPYSSLKITYQPEFLYKGEYTKKKLVLRRRNRVGHLHERINTHIF